MGKGAIRTRRQAPGPTVGFAEKEIQMTLKKPLIIATLGAAVALAGISTRAEAGDPVLGALLGGGIGAAIGHDVNRHGGAAVGGVLGAVIGSSIAADSGYYDRGYYNGGYYAPAPVY